MQFFTIGYQGRTLEELLSLLQENGIKFVVDVRSKPNSRFKPDFNKKRLGEALDQCSIEYKWKGDILGGFGEIKDPAIQALAMWGEGKVFCLLCMERDSKACHRSEIASRLVPYGLEAIHF